MTRKLIITATDNKIISTIIENDTITEIHPNDRAQKDDAPKLGSIFIGKVKNIIPNIRAAFIDIGQKQECYYALDQNLRPVFTTKKSVRRELAIGDELLVQIEKEAVSGKVPTVTSNLSFQGKYAVLTVGIRKLGVSAKIGQERRCELLSWIEEYASDDYGIIVRTNARDINRTVLDHEIRSLQGQCHNIITAAPTRTCYSCLHTAPAEYLTDIRNVYQEGLTEIVIEDHELYHEVKEFLLDYQPEDVLKLHHYCDPTLPLHKLHSIETTLANALKEKVWLKSGAYLVIQPTEALTVIDVNTGKAIAGKRSEGYLKFNLEAAQEAARQIRLRNISGIILIDFINMSDKDHMEKLLNYLRNCLNTDPIPTTLVDVTKLQLVEITRKKIRKPLRECV